MTLPPLARILAAVEAGTVSGVRRRMVLAGIVALGASAVGLTVAFDHASLIAPKPTIRRIGVLGGAGNGPIPEGFRQGLRDYGWVEGQNIVVESRFVDG
jgi:hypothetical protein